MKMILLITTLILSGCTTKTKPSPDTEFISGVIVTITKDMIKGRK